MAQCGSSINEATLIKALERLQEMTNQCKSILVKKYGYWDIDGGQYSILLKNIDGLRQIILDGNQHFSDDDNRINSISSLDSFVEQLGENWPDD